MALIEIEYGSLASSSTINNNFSHLENRLNSYNENIVSIQNNISSLNSTLSHSISNTKSELNSVIDELKSQTDEKFLSLEESTSLTVLGNSLAPDYSKAVGISLPYTVTSDGYVYARIYTGDSVLGVFVNEQPVFERSSSQYGGITAQGGFIFRVSVGDNITTNGSLQLAKFYPLKGEV